MHQCIEEEDLMEIATLAFPRQNRILGFIKGASGSVSSHPLRACLEYLPDHADRSFQAFQKGIFCLGEIGRTGSTFVHDTATMILCGIEQMISNIRRVTYRALES